MSRGNMHYRTCVLCDRQLPNNQRTCTPCFRKYGEYFKEDWFIALSSMQQKQDSIDHAEIFQLPYTAEVSLHGVLQDTPKSGKRGIGRPLTDWRVMNHILAIYDEAIEEQTPLSLRKITTLVNAHFSNKKQKNMQITHLTVRAVLMRYRSYGGSV